MVEDRRRQGSFTREELTCARDRCRAMAEELVCAM
jgi:hypothetical protein